jgi:hypothetical protein
MSATTGYQVREKKKDQTGQSISANVVCDGSFTVLSEDRHPHTNGKGRFKY